MTNVLYEIQQSAQEIGRTLFLSFNEKDEDYHTNVLTTLMFITAGVIEVLSDSKINKKTKIFELFSSRVKEIITPRNEFKNGIKNESK